MKTPWINNSQMQEINSKQMIGYKSSSTSSDSKHVSKVDDSKKTDNCLKLAGSTNCKHNFKNICAYLTNDTSRTDFTFGLQYPSEYDIMEEKKNLNEKNEVVDTEPTEEKKNIAQIDSPIDLQQTTESDLMNEIEDLHEKEEVVELKPAEETKDIAQTNSVNDLQQLTESDFDLINEIEDFHEKEDVMFDPEPAEEKKNIGQIDSANDLQQPTKSDLMNEMKNLLGKEEMIETNPAEEPINIAQTDSVNDLQQPTESDFKYEIKDLYENEEMVETHLAEETNDITQIDSAIDLQQPTESEFMNEIKDLLGIEEMIETNLAEEIKDIAQSDSANDLQNLSESAFIIEMKDLSENGEVDESHPADYSSGIKYSQGKVCFMTKKSPFSIHVEIDDFLHEPIYGDVIQNTFDYLDQNNKHTPEFETKLINITAYYPEQPDFRLVSSKINEIAFLSDDQNVGTNFFKGNPDNSIVVPLHDSLFTKAVESNHSYVHIRVPVVLGEYKIEICLEENVTFLEEVSGIKEISKEVVLTNFRLIPSVFSQSLNNGTRSVLKGKLFIEGYIDQKITYTAFSNKNTKSLTPLNSLYQKILVELIIDILQVQQVRVKS